MEDSPEDSKVKHDYLSERFLRRVGCPGGWLADVAGVGSKPDRHSTGAVRLRLLDRGPRGGLVGVECFPRGCEKRRSEA